MTAFLILDQLVHLSLLDEKINSQAAILALLAKKHGPTKTLKPRKIWLFLKKEPCPMPNIDDLL